MRRPKSLPARTWSSKELIALPASTTRSRSDRVASVQYRPIRPGILPIVLPTNQPGRPHARPGRVAVLLVAVALVVASGLAYAFRRDLTSLPVGVPGVPAPSSVPTEALVTPDPIETGHLVGPAASGEPEVQSADTMPLERPIFTYTGSQPWQIATRPDATHVLEGYASRPSYLPGETLRLAVSTTASTYDVAIFRVSGKAPVAGPFVQVASEPGQAGRRQSPPAIDPITKMATARWQYDFTYAIPKSWKSDVYLVRLSSSEGVQSYVPFVLRSPVAHRILVVSNAMNWEAYNRWGGSSAYTTDVGQPMPGVTRALAVSFDRPYASDGGAGQLFFLELPLVSWLLRQNLDVAFTTDYDLSLDPDAQPLPKVVVFNAHDEYWGVPLYQWLQRHVNVLGDMGLAMLAADTGYWPVTFAHPTADGPRDMLVFKNGPVPAELLAPGQTPGPTASGAPVDSPAPGDIEERSSRILWEIPASGPYVGSLPGQPVFGVHYQGVTTALGRYSLAGAPPVTGPNAGPTAAPSPGASASSGAPGTGTTSGASTAAAVPTTTSVAPTAALPATAAAPITTAAVPTTAAAAAATTPTRLLAGTGLSAGSSLGFIAGGEVDGVRDTPAWWGPAGGQYDHSFAIAADIPGRLDYSCTAEAVWRELPNGGRVFSSGTFYWGWALDPAWGRAHEVPPGFGRLTLNILEWLAGG